MPGANLIEIAKIKDLSKNEYINLIDQCYEVFEDLFKLDNEYYKKEP